MISSSKWIHLSQLTLIITWYFIYKQLLWKYDRIYSFLRIYKWKKKKKLRRYAKCWPFSFGFVVFFLFLSKFSYCSRCISNLFRLFTLAVWLMQSKWNQTELLCLLWHFYTFFLFFIYFFQNFSAGRVMMTFWTQWLIGCDSFLEAMKTINFYFVTNFHVIDPKPKKKNLSEI